MILGWAVNALAMLLLGGALFVLTTFQVLDGLRIIKIGKLHRVVHKYNALAIVSIAAVHGLLGILFVTGWSIL